MSNETFQQYIERYFGNSHKMYEYIDNPIVSFIGFTDRVIATIWDSPQEIIMPPHQAHLIEHIEIKNVLIDQTQFTSKECKIHIILGNKIAFDSVLQLFWYDRKKESYNYELRLPIFLPSQLPYRIITKGIIADELVFILHGRRARPLQ